MHRETQGRCLAANVQAGQSLAVWTPHALGHIIVRRALSPCAPSQLVTRPVHHRGRAVQHLIIEVPDNTRRPGRGGHIRAWRSVVVLTFEFGVCAGQRLTYPIAQTTPSVCLDLLSGSTDVLNFFQEMPWPPAVLIIAQDPISYTCDPLGKNAVCYNLRFWTIHLKHNCEVHAPSRMNSVFAQTCHRNLNEFS